MAMFAFSAKDTVTLLSAVHIVGSLVEFCLYSLFIFARLERW